MLPTIDPVRAIPCHRHGQDGRGRRRHGRRPCVDLVEQQAALLAARTRCTACSCRSCSPAVRSPSSATRWRALRGRCRRHHHRRPGARHRGRRRVAERTRPWTASTAPAASSSRASRWARATPTHRAVTRAVVQIVAGTSDHGLLGRFTPERPLTAADVHLLERAATVAALAITKEQAVAAVEGKYRAEFLRDALAGRAGDPADAVAHAASLGWDIARPMVVVVAETDENDDADHPLTATRCVPSRSGSCGPGFRRCAPATPAPRSRASARRSSRSLPARPDDRAREPVMRTRRRGRQGRPRATAAAGGAPSRPGCRVR